MVFTPISLLVSYVHGGGPPPPHLWHINNVLIRPSQKYISGDMVEVKQEYMFTFIGIANEQVYKFYGDIIISMTNEWYFKKFYELMSKEFEISMIGELTFFLGF